MEDYEMEQKMVQAYNLNEEKRIFYRKLFKVGFPVLIQQIVSIGLNLVDTIMVGKVSENALAAVGAANQVYFIYSVVIFGMPCSTGAFGIFPVCAKSLVSTISCAFW